MITLRFVDRAKLAPAGWWLASKRGDEAVADVAPLHRLPAPPADSPLTPLLELDRPTPVFRFTYKLVITPKIDGLADTVMYEGGTYDVTDQWDGDSGLACRTIEDDLQRLVLRPGRRVVVTGGYVAA